MMKKGQLSIQFNWIFIFLVGVGILAFFLLFIRNQTRQADEEATLDIINNLETIIKSAENSEGTLKFITMPQNSNLELVCDGNSSFFKLGRKQIKEMPYDIIFSLNNLEGEKIITWTQGWDLPFRIGMFQYLTTPNILYVVVNSSNSGSLPRELFQALPSNISKKFVKDGVDLRNQGYKHYRIIYFNKRGTVNAPEGASSDYLILHVRYGLDSYGEVDYSDGTSIWYVKKELLFGAIFSQNGDFYTCTVIKAMERLKSLMKLHQARAQELKEEVNQTVCRTALEYASQTMQVMIDNTDLNDNVLLYEKSKLIESDNENLIRGHNCPLIY